MVPVVAAEPSAIWPRFGQPFGPDSASRSAEIGYGTLPR
jgi:hypothetical protein